MLKKNNFFNNFFFKSSTYNSNLKKTNFVFNSLLKDLKNGKLASLESYSKNYKFDFSKNLIKKFSKNKNIIIIGMGGSILGTKAIYSFLRNKVIRLRKSYE